MFVNLQNDEIDAETKRNKIPMNPLERGREKKQTKEILAHAPVTSNSFNSSNCTIPESQIVELFMSLLYVIRTHSTNWIWHSRALHRSVQCVVSDMSHTNTCACELSSCRVGSTSIQSKNRLLTAELFGLNLARWDTIHWYRWILSEFP